MTSPGYSPLPPLKVDTAKSDAVLTASKSTCADRNYHQSGQLADVVVLASSSASSSTTKRISIRRVFAECCQMASSRSLLPVLGCAALLAVSHGVLRSTHRVLVGADPVGRGPLGSSEQPLLSSLFADTLRANLFTSTIDHVTASNDYVIEEATYLHHVILAGSGSGAHSELFGLQALLNRFNSELQQMSVIYAYDDVTGREPANWTQCVAKQRVIASSTSAHIVPCNFIPVQHNIFNGEQIDQSEVDVILPLWQLFECIRRLIVRTSYALLVAMVIVYLLRGAMLFVCRRLAMTSYRYGYASKSGISTRILDVFARCRSRTDDVGEPEDVDDENFNDDVIIGSPQHSLDLVGAISFNRLPASDLRYVETKV